MSASNVYGTQIITMRIISPDNTQDGGREDTHNVLLRVLLCFFHNLGTVYLKLALLLIPDTVDLFITRLSTGAQRLQPLTLRATTLCSPERLDRRVTHVSRRPDTASVAPQSRTRLLRFSKPPKNTNNNKRNRDMNIEKNCIEKKQARR